MSDPTTGVGRMITAILADDEKNLGNLRDLLSGRFALESYVTHRCRGSLPGCPLDRRGVPLWREMVILEAAVPEAQAEAVFEAIYETCLAGRQDGAMLLLGQARRIGLAVSPD